MKSDPSKNNALCYHTSEGRVTYVHPLLDKLSQEDHMDWLIEVARIVEEAGQQKESVTSAFHRLQILLNSVN